MDPQQLQQLVAEDFKIVNQNILAQLHSDVDLVETISQYLVDSGGKRVRPLLVLLAANCCNYQGKKHTFLAAIIEFLHTATLLHDDVVDISEMRRGRSTANAVWGNAPSVLVGDFLYSRAFQMMVEMKDLRVMSILADSTNQIAEGEVNQLVNVRNVNLSEKEYRELIKAKTAVLFQASSHCAAVLANADQKLEDAMKAFGMHLGMTFQIIDDLLDYDGDAEEMGKNVGDDLAEGKMTLPLIYLIENANTADSDLVRKAITEKNSSHMHEIIDLVKKSDALQYTREQANLEAAKALTAIEAAPSNRYSEGLRDLVGLAVNRSN